MIESLEEHEVDRKAGQSGEPETRVVEYVRSEAEEKERASARVAACIRACDGGDVWMYRVGKKAAGRLLDGREWNEMPK